MNADQRIQALRSALNQLVADLTERGTHRSLESEPNQYVRGQTDGKAVVCRTTARRLDEILNADLGNSEAYWAAVERREATR